MEINYTKKSSAQKNEGQVSGGKAAKWDRYLLAGAFCLSGAACSSVNVENHIPIPKAGIDGGELSDAKSGSVDGGVADGAPGKGTTALNPVDSSSGSVDGGVVDDAAQGEAGNEGDSGKGAVPVIDGGSVLDEGTADGNLSGGVDEVQGDAASGQDSPVPIPTDAERADAVNGADSDSAGNTSLDAGSADTLDALADAIPDTTANNDGKDVSGDVTGDSSSVTTNDSADATSKQDSADGPIIVCETGGTGSYKGAIGISQDVMAGGLLFGYVGPDGNDHVPPAKMTIKCGDQVMVPEQDYAVGVETDILTGDGRIIRITPSQVYSSQVIATIVVEHVPGWDAGVADASTSDSGVSGDDGGQCVRPIGTYAGSVGKKSPIGVADCSLLYKGFILPDGGGSSDQIALLNITCGTAALDVELSLHEPTVVEFVGEGKKLTITTTSATLTTCSLSVSVECL